MINCLVKTEYSFRYAYGKIKDIISNSKDVAAITDRFTTFGHIPFFKECKKQNKKPILGVELAFVDNAKLKVKQNPSWVNLIAINQAGLKKIYELVSKSTGQKYYYNRLDLSELGKIDPKNVIIVYKDEQAMKHLKGRPNTFLGVCAITPYNLIQKTEHKFLAVSDNLYDKAEHEILYQIIMGNGQWEDSSHSRHILDEWEWRHENKHLDGECAEAAISNTKVLADSVECFEFPKAKLPKATETRSLKELCVSAANDRKINLEDQVYRDRLERELDLIHEKKFEEYFYLVWDLVCYAKKHMLVGPARGSSAGSLVCYLLYITDIDPIPHGLIFERFIDINRMDMPDIDIDFQDTKRDMLIDYLKDKYGRDCVAKLGTTSQYKPKVLLTELAKVSGVPVWEINDLKNAIPERSGGDARANNCIEDTFKDLEIGKLFLEKYPQFIYAKEIESHMRHTGQHAAGIVVSDSPLYNYCAIDQISEGAMLDKKDAETVNLLKMDCLGLRTLSVLQDCIDLIKKDRDWLINLKLNDQKAFDVVNERKFAGIFQFEGYALINTAKQIYVDEFDTVSAIGALARPGPLVSGGTNKYIVNKNQPDNIKYLPKCEEYTKKTYGVVVYQEQLMQISRGVGALSWEDTSELRKAASKSLGDEFFGKYKEKFIKGAIEVNKLPAEEAELVWSSICTFGSWAFNKCISGKTKIKMGAAGGSLKQWTTIEELYEMYISNPTHWTKYRKPFLQSLYPDGKVRPQHAVNIFKNGLKDCWEYSFEDGTEIVCTKDHKFIINGDWKACGKSKIGDEFSYSVYDKLKNKGRNSHCKGKKYEKTNRGFLKGAENPSYINGKTEAVKKFRNKMKNNPCQDTGKFHQRMEIHHNDFDHGSINPNDLSWLTPSAHKKRHYENNRKKRWEKGHIVLSKKLIKIKHVGMEMTYDIEMPNHHNYVIEGGIITHNSHSISYGLISYWCMVLKAYFPLEFALATLQNAKSEDQVIGLLKELSKEGFTFKPFDKDLSEVGWSIKDGSLVGGFTNVKGIGPKKAKSMIRKIKGGEVLTVAEKRSIYNAETPYDKIFEFRENFSGFYDNWELFFKEQPVYLQDIEDGEVVRFIAKSVSVSLRDANEEILVKKRNGEVIKDGKTNFLDIKFADDTDTVPARIDRWKFESFGRDISEKHKLGSYYLVQGQCCKGFKFIMIKNIKRITKEEILEKIKRSKE
jgi:hypothetical protein